MTKKILLAIFAHTDDETLLAGTLLAKCASEGIDVRVLAVAGGHDDRYERFLRATRELGVSTVYNLRYDGTKYRTEAGDEGVMSIAAAPAGELASRIRGRIEEVAPDAIVTHSADGDYGHPDHSAVHNASVRALERLGATEIDLFALAWPGLMARLARRLMSGSDGQRAQVTHSIKAGRWISDRKRAARHYRPEISEGPLPMRLMESFPAWAQRPVFGTTHLTRLKTAQSRDRSIFE